MPEINPQTIDRSAHLFIAGGGLAGLSLAIQVARAGFRVVLAEKESYPFHRVCGEYISMEAWDFLEQLGVPISAMNLPRISELTVTAPNGRSIHHRLPMGGFGLSRFTLDQTLAGIARRAGVEVLEQTKVQDIRFVHQQTGNIIAETNSRIPKPDRLHFQIQTSASGFLAKTAVGSFGKRANLDIRWKRPFATEKAGPLSNYIGVKYHVKGSFARDRIWLHNFQDGYCGMSAVEGDDFCLCYLTTAENLRRSDQKLEILESQVLGVNPHLREIFSKASFNWPEPVTISQISFACKELIRDHLLFCGDAAGMITPLCGNGMSMALHGSKILAGQLIRFLEGRQDMAEMENNYRVQWERTFAGRLRTGRWIQSMFGKPLLTNLFISSLKPFPAAVDLLIRQTHGDIF